MFTFVHMRTRIKKNELTHLKESILFLFYFKLDESLRVKVYVKNEVPMKWQLK